MLLLLSKCFEMAGDLFVIVIVILISIDNVIVEMAGDLGNKGKYCYCYC